MNICTLFSSYSALVLVRIKHVTFQTNWLVNGELPLRANRLKKSRFTMFELRGAEPGKAGMRPLVHVPDGSSYKNAKPYTIPIGAYEDINNTTPCEIRLGSQGRGIWVKPQLPDEYVPRPGMCTCSLFVMQILID